MKRTITFAEVTTADYLANLPAGDVNGFTYDPLDLSDPYPSITYVAPYSDGVHDLIRIRFYDTQWRQQYTSTRFPTDTLVVSDVQIDPVVPTVTGVQTVLTYSDGTVSNYTGTKQ